ncbi:MAG TPA: DUF2252 family protein [Gemmatimonadaceae bacterium]|jgi:uncharacterized protein (DUF2252 family)|nr:DUF2252 family protein [Gemmatimonadaceae bacterium]
MGGVVERIQAFNADREPERLVLKYQRMRLNAFAFFRGTAHLFYEDWTKGGPLDAAPLAWLSGDLHLENFGSYKGDNRLGYFDLNDFDEAYLAPATWDLGRFTTSLYLAADALKIGDSDTRILGATFLDTYGTALHDGKARWVERSTAEGIVRELLRRVKRRTRRQLLDSMTTGRHKGRKFTLDAQHRLVVSRADRAAVVATMKTFGASEHCPEEFSGGFLRVLDVVRRVAGTGSLGVRRFAILVEGRGGPDGNFVLDLKEARRSALAPYATAPQPGWPSEAARVAGIQRRAEAIAPALLHAVNMGKSSYVLKELQPLIDRLTIDETTSGTDLGLIMVAMGHVVAWSHLRGSGRQGSGIADDLVTFGAERWWVRETLAYARRYREVVKGDYEVFAKAYDEGKFNAT